MFLSNMTMTRMAHQFNRFRLAFSLWDIQIEESRYWEKSSVVLNGLRRCRESLYLVIAWFRTWLFWTATLTCVLLGGSCPIDLTPFFLRFGVSAKVLRRRAAWCLGCYSRDTSLLWSRVRQDCWHGDGYRHEKFFLQFRITLICIWSSSLTASCKSFEKDVKLLIRSRWNTWLSVIPCLMKVSISTTIEIRRAQNGLQLKCCCNYLIEIIHVP